MTTVLLTDLELATAAGLDLAATRRYCRLFAAYLDCSDMGNPTGWAARAVETLQIIRLLDAAGYSREEILDDLAAAEQPHPQLRPGHNWPKPSPGKARRTGHLNSLLRQTPAPAPILPDF
jgi:hypothetical protein